MVILFINYLKKFHIVVSDEGIGLFCFSWGLWSLKGLVLDNRVS